MVIFIIDMRHVLFITLFSLGCAHHEGSLEEPTSLDHLELLTEDELEEFPESGDDEEQERDEED